MARGAGKSYLMSMASLLFKDDPEYNGIYFRREYGQIMAGGGLWETGMKMYPQFGAKPNIANVKFTFPSGAKVRYSHMFTENDKESHRGSQYTGIFLDELTSFSKTQVTFLMTCLRSEAQVDSFCFASTNPSNDSWVKELITWYIGDDGFPIEERCGVIRYFVVLDNEFIFGDSEEYFKETYPQAVYVTNPYTQEVTYIPPKTFTFINGTAYDNPAMLAANPKYLSELNNLPDHERLMMLHGNWNAAPKSSNYFQREWLVEVDTFPAKAKCCRAWDKAASEPSQVEMNPDYTACSPRMYMYEGLYYMVWDVHPDLYDRKDNEKSDAKDRVTGRFRLRAGERDLKILQQAVYDGKECHVIFPVDPGSAGKVEYESSAKFLVGQGIVVKKDPMPNNKSKLLRFQPFASACQNGLVRVVRSSFPNDATYNKFMTELENFTGERSTRISKDDWVDAVASSFNYISKMKTIRDFTLPTLSGNSATVLSALKF